MPEVLKDAKSAMKKIFPALKLQKGKNILPKASNPARNR
jgi:hypothetical protein